MAESSFAQKKKEKSYNEKTEIPFLKPKQQSQVDEHIRNWLELPSDVMVNILNRIDVVDLHENAQNVCTTWRTICKDPALWRVIHMKCISGSFDLPEEIFKNAVDLSQGQLVDVNVVGFINNELLQYVADRSSKLKRLELSTTYMFMNWRWSRAMSKFPMLEELNIYQAEFSHEGIETLGRCCPMLRTLKVNQEKCMFWHGDTDEKSLMIRNKTAIAIGKNLLELRHLELIGNRMTNIGLKAILDGCCHLESLDLRQCMYIDLKGKLGKKCSERFKCLKLPGDSVEGCHNLYAYNCMDCDYESFRTRLLRGFRNL